MHCRVTARRERGSATVLSHGEVIKFFQEVV